MVFFTDSSRTRAVMHAGIANSWFPLKLCQGKRPRYSRRMRNPQSYLYGKRPMDTTWDPDSKVHGANMGPFWGRQDPDGPHVGPMNFAIWGKSSFDKPCGVCGLLYALVPNLGPRLLTWININLSMNK